MTFDVLVKQAQDVPHGGFENMCPLFVRLAAQRHRIHMMDEIEQILHGAINKDVSLMSARVQKSGSVHNHDVLATKIWTERPQAVEGHNVGHRIRLRDTAIINKHHARAIVQLATEQKRDKRVDLRRLAVTGRASEQKNVRILERVRKLNVRLVLRNDVNNGNSELSFEWPRCDGASFRDAKAQKQCVQILVEFPALTHALARPSRCSSRFGSRR
mmetsp:Transcript_9308/g.24627  ORF Transcript_9308/g.24627 Transcript_9308/m.24627 type:complete len:215 (-) Transcript_9308:843-1487(-)